MKTCHFGLQNYLSVSSFDQLVDNLHHEALQEHFHLINKIFPWSITGIQQNFKYKYCTYLCNFLVERIIRIHPEATILGIFRQLLIHKFSPQQGVEIKCFVHRPNEIIVLTLLNHSEENVHVGNPHNSSKFPAQKIILSSTLNKASWTMKAD